ncbi:hypothetical protein GOP47_0019771 [Adiantum capillus-veneris]|uniref:Xyloglucan endotransglucosylase/hydrolase n=1 Tax=Adiantum capillus-veneris TaxID=13818 RepID=A0A9D4UBQ2_ADICA|nr:hypothetical protein GOP47_0019771 [Adiantum capillus-veneris]
MGVMCRGYIGGRFYFLVVWIMIASRQARGEDVSSFFKLSSSERAKFVDDNQEIQLSLDQSDGSGFSSYSEFLFGMFNMRIKMIPGDSAGTVTTYYFTSFGATHDELDFEFLGNQTGEPIILQTNVYASGVGDREQRIFLWFDPAADFHNYTLLWNTQQVVFYVDGVPIRVYPNIQDATGVPYLQGQPMYLFGTIWNGDSWATQGGKIKTDWTLAPFIASYRDFSVDACADKVATSTCASTKWWNQQQYEALDSSLLGQLNWVKENYMVYDYCTDYARFNATPIECGYTTPTPSTSPTLPPNSSPLAPTSPSSATPPLSPTSNSRSSTTPPLSPTSNSSAEPIPPSLAPSQSKAPNSNHLQWFLHITVVAIFLFTFTT